MRLVGIRSSTTAVLVTLSLGLTGLFATTTAHADSESTLLTCSGTQGTTFDPPLTNTTKSTTVSIIETYRCTDVGGNITSAATSFQVTEPLSCAVALDIVRDTSTYTWSTGNHTTLTETTVVTMLADGSADVSSTGHATGGTEPLIESPDSLASHEIILPAPSVQACSGSGMATETGTATLIVSDVL